MNTEHVLTPDDKCPCGKPQDGSGYCSYECYSKHDNEMYDIDHYGCGGPCDTSETMD